MSLFDVTSWGVGTSMLTNIPKIINNFISLKAEVDGARAGLSIKAPALVATTGNITLSGLQTIDGIALSANARVLVKNQTTLSQNGIYTAQAGAWTRTADSLVTGTALWITSGTVNGSTRWVLTTEGTIVAGTTALTFTQDFQNTNILVGAGLLKNGNQIELVETTKAAEAAASADEAAASETNAKTSETNAAASELSALGYKNSAQSSAETATAQAILAQTNGLYLPADNLTITYNADGTVNTVSNGTITKRITYSNGVATAISAV